MKTHKLESYSILPLSLILGSFTITPAFSQPITPANDGTGTTVTPQGNQFNIEGGTHNGANLFHSFDQFNVNSGQTANFLTTPDTQNILGRVTGGNASIINGLIQITGGNSNLFLMNPAGIMFGPNASLNIPASFSVTTATGIGFNDNNFWFQAIGTNDYSNLVGNPSGYRFDVSNPGAIVNEGNLTLNPGENLTLLGGTVINTGQLSTPGGNITIAAVEGGSILRISQPENLLSLEVNSITVNGEDTEITPLSLPELLTGGEIIQATSVTVNENGDVVLTDSNTVVADEPGTAIASGGIDVSGSEDVGGQVNILGDRLALIDTDINADGLNGGGKVLIGGESQESSTVFNSQETFVNSGSIISANAIENGDGGSVIIWSDGTTNFAGNISAKGGKFSGNGGFVEVTGKQELTFDGSVDVTAALGEDGTILLQPESITIGEPENSDSSEIVENDTEVETTEVDDSERTETEVETDIFAQDENADVTISAENIGQLSGNVILEADNDITVNEKIETDSSVELKAGRSININADIDTSVGNGNIDLFGNNDEMNLANRSNGKASINQLDGTTLNAGSGRINIELGNLGEVGDINLGNLTTTGQVLVNANGGNIARVSENSLINAGSVLFQTSGNGGIGLIGAPLQLNVENLEAVSGSGGVFFDVGNVNVGGVSEEVNGISTGVGGDIVLESEGDVTVTENISTDLFTDGGTAGDINIAAENLSVIDGAEIAASTSAKGDAGNVEIDTTDTVVVDGGDSGLLSLVLSDVNSGAEGNGGNVTITTPSLEVKNGAVISASTFGKGDAGNVEVNATDSVIFDRGDLGFLTVVASRVFSGAEGNGGNVTITTNSLEVKNGAQISASTFGKGDAGNVEIIATDTVFLDGGDSGVLSGVLSDVNSGAEGNGGNVTITTPSLEVKNGAEISASTFGKGDAGNVEVNATDTVIFDRGDLGFFTGAVSSVFSGGEGNGGNVTITTNSLEVKNGAEISANTFGKGDAGNVEINATDIVIFDERNSPFFTGVTSTVEAGGEGNGGNVTITTSFLELKNGGQISANTVVKGDAGNVEINATDTVIFDGGNLGFFTGVASTVNPGGEGNGGSVTITTKSLEAKNGAQISANTLGKGNAGSVDIIATDTIVFDQGNSPFSTGVASTVFPGAEGNGGNVTITTNSLEVKNGARISATTFGKGDAGSVKIDATDTIVFERGNSLFLTGVASRVNPGAEGNGGNVTITTNSLEVKNGAEISASTFGKGDAGSVDIIATDTVIFDGGNLGFLTGVNSTVEPGGEGNGGDVTITTRSLEIKNGGQIFTAIFGEKGDAGNVKIDATDSVIFDGGNSPLFTRVNSTVEPGGEGNGGSVTITTRSLAVKNGAQISAATRGNGDAGNIFITTDTQLTITTNSQIRAFSETNGTAGNIILFAPENLNISGDGQITVSSSGEGNAGQIDILSPNITLSDGINITAFTESTGNAGIINLEGENINIQPNTRILAFTEGEGDGGNITVRATETLNLETDSQLSVETNRNGKAGNIEINTPQLTIGENAQISATVNLGATTTEPGGNITINTNELNIAGELGIFAETEATADAGSLTLNPYKTNPNLDITFSNDGFISASTSSTGNGGNINISAPENINIQGDGNISVETTDRGNAGIINIDTRNLTLSDRVTISASTTDKGNAGAININTRNLTLETGTNLTTETNNQGQAGDIEINTRQLTIGEDAQISATARVGATNTEAGGNITINATDLFISGRLGIFAETAGESPAGTLTLNPYRNNPNLNITFTEQGFISARTTSTGDGGNINISAPENIDISGEGKISVETTGNGNAGIINIETENLNLSDQVAISAETNSSGTAGNIVINSQTLTIGKDTEISATAQKEATSTEEGGNITINTNDLLISGRLGIFAETEGKANAGTLTINPYREVGEQGSRGVGEFNPNLNITFTENGFISARTLSTGDGGNINIFAPENINISGEGRITVETEGAGNAGTINIETENLTIAENTTISAATSDSGDGGSININPTETFQLEGQILTETTGTGSGGAITINTGEMTAPNSTISAKSTNAGNAGTIEITAQENITTGIISSQANNQNETADGGNITITSEQGEINATQPIQSFSERANAGNVTLTAQNNITTNTISSHGQQQGGQITITSETGNIDTSNSQFLANYSGGGDGGNVTIEAPQGNITTSDIYSFADADGGKITLKAGGDINITENSNIISASEPPETEGERESGGVGRGGDIILEAGNNINTTTARIFSGANVGDTGKIDIIADGAIETGQIDLASGFVRDRVTVNQNFTLIPIPQGEATQGFAGNITFNSNNSTIDTTGGTINSRSPDGSGDITINARENITTGKLEASALNPNKPTTGGDVSITSTQAQINATQAIETFSERGTAGNVNIKAEGSVNIENILSQGTQRGGDITIESRSQNSINAQGELNTFSTEGIAGDVNLTSPGSITINGIRSQGMEQGGTITVESEIGNIDSTGGDIDSFSDQGIGGNVTLNAPESVNLANVSSFGSTESGDLIIQSRTAAVNTGNVTTEAPAGSSGSIIINGEEVGTGDLSSIGTTSAGEINVEATDGSITTYDIEISSDGTIGDLILRAPEDITTGDINQNAGEGDANTNIESGEDQTTGDITQTAENDTNNVQIAEGDITTGDITQTAGNDTNNIQIADGNQNIGDVTQNAGNDTNNIQIADGNQNIGDVTQNAGNDTNNIQIADGNQNIGNVTQNAGNDANNIQIADGNQNIGDVTQTAGNDTNNIQLTDGNQNIGDVTQTAGNVTQIAGNDTNNIQVADGNQNIGNVTQTFGNESINVQTQEINQNTDNTSVIPNSNNQIINPPFNQESPQTNNNANLLNNSPNNTATNSVEINTSTLTSTITPSNNDQTTNTATAKEQTEESINNTTDTQQILKIIDTINTNPLTVATGSDQVVTMLEENRTQEYSDYFGEDFNQQLLQTKNVRDILTDMAEKTGKESAVVYINSYPEQLQIILYTKSGKPIIKTIAEANRQKLMEVVLELRLQITDPTKRYTDSYLSPAQQLYDWFIAPISAELKAANIETLLFSMDEGLRTLPVAALHDG
ncbi:MAG: filamentous hemagglutinin N-terminal domain-containing protein, partial [Okeania sp. SIO3H1]|nr:filamentous hemagglutinin N-terminal domain-containing protein [Okeania sp. SIO3H1]